MPSEIRGKIMFSHLGAVLLASGALVLLSTVHSISTEVAHPQATIMLVPAFAPASRAHAIVNAPVSGIAIGY
jgi:hypothetical protein